MNTRFAAIMLAVLISGYLAGQTSPQIKKTPVQKTSPASGLEMYTQYCASCHGKDGKGKGPAAVALKTAPTDLTALTAKDKGSFPDFRIAQVIEGSDNLAAHGSQEMPIWGQIFHQMDGSSPDTSKLRIANLVSHIKTLQAK